MQYTIEYKYKMGDEQCPPPLSLLHDQNTCMAIDTSPRTIATTIHNLGSCKSITFGSFNVVPSLTTPPHWSTSVGMTLRCGGSVGLDATTYERYDVSPQWAHGRMIHVAPAEGTPYAADVCRVMSDEPLPAQQRPYPIDERPCYALPSVLVSAFNNAA